MALDRACLLFGKGKEILQRHGLITFIKQAFFFLVKAFFRYGNYYIYIKTLNEMDEQFKPDVQNCTLNKTAIYDPVLQIMNYQDAGYIEPCDTNPVYRGRGLYPYVFMEICKFLKENEKG